MPVSKFSRYANIKTLRAPGNDAETLVTSLQLRPPVEAASYPDSIIHTVVGGETLDALAHRYYGREDLWWRIMDANDLYPDDAGSVADVRLFALRAGDRLIIPPVRAATRFPRS